MTDSAQSHGKQEGESQSAWEKRIGRLQSQTVLDTLETLGFDTDDRNEIQKDIIFLRKLRVANEATNAKLVASAIGLVFTLIGAFITLAAQSFWPK